MPALHSLITFIDGAAHLEAISPAPTLAVNGRGVQEAVLSDGDVIGIGEVELLARISTEFAPAAVQLAEAGSASADAEQPLSELSAVEVIDRIEAEERRLTEFDERRRAGARTLVQSVMRRASKGEDEKKSEAPGRPAIPAPHFLSKRPQVLAARSRSARPAEGTSPRGDNPELLAELEQLERKLTALTGEIQTITRRSGERDSQHSAAADLLIETQHKLASQLETLVSQVASMQQASGSPKPRAIA